MEVVYEEGSVKDLITELEKDLENIRDLKALARVPEPSRGRRYREILYSNFVRLGFVAASVVLEFKNGVVKSYVFIGKAIPSKDTNNYLNMPVHTEGYLVEKSREKIIHKIYNPYIYRSGKDLFNRVKELGDRFRLSDLEVYMERIQEYLEYDSL